MPLNPIAFTDRVVSSFLRYQLTAYPFADTRLDKQMRDLLSLAKTRATPLLKGPYLTLSRPFEQGCSVQQLIDEGLLHALLRERIPSAIENVYRHQEEAIRSIDTGRTTLISTGTGSGKTECFLYPVISRCLKARDAGEPAGIVAVLVYPMNALAEDQLLRLRGLLAGTGISFGMYVGKTPRKKSDVSGRRLQHGASRADYEQQMEEVRILGSGETVYPGEEVCSREEMRTAGKQPRILLTNVNQLELLLTRQTDVELFSDARLDYLVFDEAHTFTGAQGAETACLVRRLLRYCEKDPGDTTCIATSATIVDPNDPDAAKRFASRFFGVKVTDVVTVGESYSAQIWPEKRWNSPTPTNPSDVLQKCVDAVDGPDEKIHEAFSALSGRELPEGADLQAALYEELAAAEPVFQSATLLERPMALNESAKELGTALGRIVTEEEVLSWLILGAIAQSESRPLLRPVVHAFLRGIGGASVAFPGPGDEPVLHFSAEQAAADPGPFRLPVSTCTTCGQHYFASHLHDFHHTSRMLGGGQASGTSRYWEPLDSAKNGKRCVLIDGLVSGDDLPVDRVAEVWLCRHCGTVHEQDGAHCGHCGHSDKKVALYSIQTKDESEGFLSRCLGCEANGRRWGGSYREPARPVRTTAVADIHVLAQDMINNLDPQRLLIFCDNRQDAAFQAGWMRDHARRFRLRSLIAEELQKGAQGVGDLTVSLSRMFEQEEGLSRALLPEVWRVVPLDAGQNHRKEREKFLRMVILREITLSPRQVLGLEPWGRMRIDYTGLSANLPFIVRNSRGLRLPPDELCSGITTLLDYLRRQRVLFDPVHKTFSKYWNDGDLEIQNGYLPQMDPPKGTKLTRAADDNENYVVQWKGISGDTYIKQAVRKWGVPDNDLPAFLEELLEFLRAGGWLVPVTLIGAKGKSLPGQSGLFQVDLGKLQLVAAQGVWKCKRCSRRTARRTPNDLCPAWRCKGTLEFTAENPDDYNLHLLDGNYDLIRPEEHTAMVPHDKRERIENWFKDPSSKAVNCLVCTQTLEMGVDIGALDAVLMRNVPPLPANYWQRVGRAGRRNRMAVDVTYCRDVSHDRSYFAAPEKLLAGGIDAPTFNLSNPLMVRRHIHATVLTRLYQEARSNAALQAILEAAVPTTVRAWLFDGNTIRKALPDLSALEQAVSSRARALLDHVKEVFAAGWPVEDSAVVSETHLKEAVEGFTQQLRSVMVRLQRRLNWAHQTVSRLNALQASTGTLEPGDEAIRRRCERYIKRIKGELKKKKSEGEGRDETVTYSVLALEGFLPGYGLERGTILGTAEIPFWESRDAGELYLPRPPLLALREYVPGNLIYANGHRFVSRRYQLLPAEERETAQLEVTVTRSALREVEPGTPPSVTSRVLQSLPMDDVDLVHVSQITDEEDYRFQMGVAVLGHERNRHSGGKAFNWGIREVHLIKAMHLRMANVGSTTEIQRRINFGYLICSVCGDSVSPLASDLQKTSFKTGHRERCGGDTKDVAEEFALHADVVADTLKFPGFADQTEAYSVLESVRLAAANRIEMVPEDLQILVIGQMDSDEVTGCLMDPMPGGSGLLEQLVERFQEIREEAITLVKTCPSACQSSCTDCLQTYRNSFYHAHLDRTVALQFLEASGDSMSFARSIPVIHYAGTTPSGDRSPVNMAERRLRRMLLAAGFPEATSWQEPMILGSGLGSTTPDAIYRPEDEDLRPVAIYLDGMSQHIHGNPQTAERDRIIRAQLREMNWEVMSITAHELHDHGAMAKHFKALARYLDRGDLRASVPEQIDWFELEEENEIDAVVVPMETSKAAPSDSKSEAMPFELVPEPDRVHFQNCLPVFPDLPIAAGSWGDESGGFSQSLEGAEDWVTPPDGIKPQTGCFVARVTGKSMEPLIPSGSWCFFGPPPAGPRKNKILIVWHASIDDPDGMGHYTLKRYESVKTVVPDDAPDTWQHVGIKLHPKNPDYQPIELELDEEGELRVVAEFLRVI
jgi:ATP-dependent helicase YprA (DUF1998 family)/rubrerythrin